MHEQNTLRVSDAASSNIWEDTNALGAQLRSVQSAIDVAYAKAVEAAAAASCALVVASSVWTSCQKAARRSCDRS